LEKKKCAFCTKKSENTLNKSICLSMECPDQKNLEHYVLDELFLKLANKKITSHLLECPFCQGRYIILKDFYSQFRKELTYSITELPGYITVNRISGIKLKSQRPENVLDYSVRSADNKSRKESGDIEKVAIFTTDEENMMIRLMRNIKSKEYILYLIADDPSLYEFVLISVDSLGKTYLTDANGKVELGHIEIDTPDDLVIQVHAPDIIYILDSHKIRTAIQEVPKGKHLLLPEGIDNRLDIKIQENAGHFDLDFVCRQNYSVRHDLIMGFEGETIFHPVRQTRHFFGFTNIPMRKNFILRLYLGE